MANGIESKPNSVIMRETFKRNEPGSFGIDFHPRDVSIMGQAVAGILTQALYEAYERDGLAPEKERPSYDFPYVENGVVPPAFSVGIRMRAAGNQTGDFVLTNRRVVYVLSLMGFSLAHEKDLSNLKEYTFDVVVNQGDNPQVIIARGSLTNNDSPQPSRTSVQRS